MTNSSFSYVGTDMDAEEPIELNAFRCRGIWRAVIQQALEDISLVKRATVDSAGSPIPIDARELYTVEARGEAARWILEGGRHFRHVCDLADLAAGSVQAKARRLVNGEA